MGDGEADEATGDRLTGQGADIGPGESLPVGVDGGHSRGDGESGPFDEVGAGLEGVGDVGDDGGGDEVGVDLDTSEDWTMDGTRPKKSGKTSGKASAKTKRKKPGMNWFQFFSKLIVD